MDDLKKCVPYMSDYRIIFEINKIALRPMPFILPMPFI